MWTSILIDALSVTSIVVIVQAIRYWKQNKKLKNNEVTQSTVEIQKAEIDLANMYKEEMLKVIDLLKTSQTQSNDNSKIISDKIDNLDTRFEKLELKLSDMEDYLNGPYHKWLGERGR